MVYILYAYTQLHMYMYVVLFRCKFYYYMLHLLDVALLYVILICGHCNDQRFIVMLCGEFYKLFKDSWFTIYPSFAPRIAVTIILYSCKVLKAFNCHLNHKLKFAIITRSILHDSMHGSLTLSFLVYTLDMRKCLTGIMPQIYMKYLGWHIISNMVTYPQDNLLYQLPC